MSKSTISTFQLFERFPDEPTARIYLESRLWPDGPRCPQCGGSALTPRPNGFYRCNPCGKFTFSVREGTIFGRSKIPLHKWIYAMYLVVTSRKGISSMQLAKEIGVTQKSAWFMLQRLREACGVLGFRERSGRTRAHVVTNRTLDFIHGEIHANVEVGAQLYTDDHMVFSDLDGLFYRHDTVNHSAGEYGRGAAHTNSIESVCAVLKRGVHGIWHHVSPKHLGRYVDEATFRLNAGNVAIHTNRRLDAFVDAVAGRRITYKEVTA